MDLLCFVFFLSSFSLNKTGMYLNLTGVWLQSCDLKLLSLCIASRWFLGFNSGKTCSVEPLHSVAVLQFGGFYAEDLWISVIMMLLGFMADSGSLPPLERSAPGWVPGFPCGPEIQHLCHAAITAVSTTLLSAVTYHLHLSLTILPGPVLHLVTQPVPVPRHSLLTDMHTHYLLAVIRFLGQYTKQHNPPKISLGVCIWWCASGSTLKYLIFSGLHCIIIFG